MNKKNIIFHSLFLIFISIWLAAIVNAIISTYANSLLTSSSFSLFAGYSGLFYWVIVGASAATSFILGLDKLGILEILWNKITVKDEGYEPEIYVAIPKSQPIVSKSKSVGKEQLLTVQNKEEVVITKVNKPAKQKKSIRKKDKMKAFYLFGETEFKSCQHKFGYLGDKLKNKPIPDECFGCPKLLDCFKTTKKSKNKKHELITVL